MNEPSNNIQPIRRVRFNSIWIVPLIAALVAAWMVYQNWSSSGPEITIVASNADGIETSKTKLKARNVDIGTVTNIRLSKDFNSAIITIQMTKNTEDMLHEDAKFWVVKPRVGKEGISGLGTLLSGAYIDMAPGEKGKLTNHFMLLNQPPLSSSEDKGIRLTLDSSETSKLSVGTAVQFRGYDVGYIEKVGFDVKKKVITYQVFIRAPYDSFVNSAVAFWVTPGLAVKSSARGLEVRMDSLETLMSGGISFGLVQHSPPGSPVSDLTTFKLYASKDEASNQFFHEYIDYIFPFESDVSGLEEGAPVELHGVRVGTVKMVPFDKVPMRDIEYNNKVIIPILARIEVQRLQIGGSPRTLDEWRKKINTSIQNGMRASLKLTNILTGAKVVSLDYDPKAKPFKAQELSGYPVFPTTQGGFSNIEKKINDVLDKLANAQIDGTLQSIKDTMGNANKTLASVKEVSQNVDKLLNQPQTQSLPNNINKAVQELQKTLEAYQNDGAIGQSLNDNLTALQKALNELQPLLRQLRNNPNTLIFDKKSVPDIQPQAGR